MSQPLLGTIAERRTCLLARTQKPAIIRTKVKHASSGLPSSTEAPPLTGKPKMLSHSETDLEQPGISQSSGSQSAPLTLGFSRMSRRKRKAMKASVRQDATAGGRWMPIFRFRQIDKELQRSNLMHERENVQRLSHHQGFWS